MKVYSQLEEAQIEQLAADPLTPVEGRIWHNTTADQFKVKINGVVETIILAAKAQTITLKDIDGGVATNTSRITVPKAPLATLNALVRRPGALAFDSLSSKLYYDNGFNLIPVGTDNTINYVTDVFNGTGSQTVFTLTKTPGSLNYMSVFEAGVYQAKTSYSVTGTTFTFLTAPIVGTGNIEINYATTLLIGVPPDATVTTDKLTTAAVTTDKIADASVTTQKIADGSVTLSKLASGVSLNKIKSAVVNQFSTTALQDIPLMTVTITTHGNPVELRILPSVNGQFLAITLTSTNPTQVGAIINAVRDGNVVIGSVTFANKFYQDAISTLPPAAANTGWDGNPHQGVGTSGFADTPNGEIYADGIRGSTTIGGEFRQHLMTVPTNFTFVDDVPAGTYTYKIQLQPLINCSTSCQASYLFANEL